MGFFDVLFGRNKLRKPNRDQFFSIITAADSLAGRTDLQPSGKGGIVFNPVESTFFENLDKELRDLLQISGKSTNTDWEFKTDNYGTRWVTLVDPEFEDLVSTIHLVSETIAEHGFADRLLAAAFQFRYDGREAYWIYNYKRGSFYPFVLSGPQSRDNALEMRLGALMQLEKIPVERELEQWYALWGIPL